MKAKPLDLPVAGSILSVRLSIAPNLEKYSLKSSLGLNQLGDQEVSVQVAQGWRAQWNVR